MTTKKQEKLFNLKISNELREAIRLDAFTQDVSMSEVVRKILESYYNIYGENKNIKLSKDN